MTTTNIIDTTKNVTTLINKVRVLIENTTGAIKHGWQRFLRECELFILNQGCTVIDLEEKDFIYGSGKFQSKFNNLSEYIDFQENYPEYISTTRVRVERIVKMTKNAYCKYSNSLLMGTDFLASFEGGTDCLVDLTKLFPQYDFDNMEPFKFLYHLDTDKELRKVWDDNFCSVCVLVECEETGEKLLIDNQGYNYARYAAFEFSLNK